MKNTSRTLLCVSIAIASLTAQADYFDEYKANLDRAQEEATRGWHFYNEEEEPEPVTTEEEPSQQAKAEDEASRTPPETVKIDVKWIRENLPKYRDMAVNDPYNKDKQAAYWTLQRLGTDMASRFQEASRRYFTMHPEMAESKRRPESGFALATYNQSVVQGKNEVMQKVFERAGIWFFYSSTCEFCIREAPIVKYLENAYGVSVLPVSLDGNPLPGGEFPDYVTDYNYERARQLGVQKTPTMYLVSNDGSKISMIAEGQVTMDELTDAILIVASESKLISDEEYQLTRDVKQQLVVGREEVIEVDREQLESSPGYLAAELQKRLLAMPTYGTSDAPVFNPDQRGQQ